MKRLKTQTDEHSCGPISLYNAFVLLNLPPPSLTFITTALKTDLSGTTYTSMKATLPRYFASSKDYTNKSNTKLKSILAEVISGSVIILGYIPSQSQKVTLGHYTTIYYKNKLIATNTASDHVVRKKPCHHLKKKHTITFKWLLEKLLDERSDVFIIKPTTKKRKKTQKS